MPVEFPDEVRPFEDFLQAKGLRSQRREKLASFGDKFLQYSDDKLAIRIFSERGIWFVDVADLAGRPDEWYDAGIIRDLIVGQGKGAMPLGDQIKLFTANWAAIVDSFAVARREETYRRLAVLEQERAKRLFPGLIS